MNSLFSIGVAIRDIVLALAAGLKEEFAPGLVTLLFLVVLALALTRYGFATRQRRKAAAWLRGAIQQTASKAEFARSIDDIQHKIAQGARSAPRKSVKSAFIEFRETCVPALDDDNRVLYNSIRPSHFFNTEDLNFSAGFWRILPGLFVTIGLFCTFLGLISALSSMDLSAGKVEASLRDLLTIASAKFIMSLIGLLCSIVFTIALRFGIGGIDKELHSLCHAIEERVQFISLEDLANQQLRATRDQREYLKTLGYELIAELGRPLREEIPAAISASISSAMAPLLNQVGQIGTDGMSSMVNDLSSRFSNDVGNALAQASERLVQAGERIGGLADRMDQSSGRMGSEMETAVARLAQAVDDLRQTLGAAANETSSVFNDGAEQLLAVMNQTLEGIRDNTAEGARAMSAASAELRASAETFRTELERAAKDGTEAARARMEATSSEASGAIDAAARGVLDAFGRTVVDITQVSEDLTKKAARDLLAPLDKVAEQLGGLVTTLADGNQGLRRLSDGVRAGSEATEQAAMSFRAASKDLVDAVAPIRGTTERVEAAVRQLAESTRNVATVVSTSAETTARSAADTLAAAKETLGGEVRAIEAALTAVSAMMEKMKGQANRLDDMDEKLGAAFETYTEHVQSAVGTLSGHVKAMQAELAPALDTMRAIVEQAEQFAPQSRRR
ncbi:hypothetical protein [Xanthobacter autotrophicus]|uniref:hypothetical protein n=1 Tax=Xanthobacter autotrophicus TaxID=280 RepID=UPI003726F1F6